LLTHRSSRARSSNWGKGKGDEGGEGKRRGRERGKGREREGVGKERNVIVLPFQKVNKVVCVKREKGGERKGAPADFRYLRYNPPQMLDLNGRLAGRGVQRREGSREGEEKKAEGKDRKWRSGLSPWRKIPAGTHASIF